MCAVVPPWKKVLYYQRQLFFVALYSYYSMIGGLTAKKFPQPKDFIWGSVVNCRILGNLAKRPESNQLFFKPGRANRLTALGHSQWFYGGRGFSGVRGAPRGLNNLRGLPSLPLGHLSNLKGALGCVIYKFEILPHITYFIQQGYFLSHEMDI